MFDWFTWSIWTLGLIILVVWIYVPIKEFAQLLRDRKSGKQDGGGQDDTPQQA